MLNQRGSVQQSIMEKIIEASSDEMNRRKTLDKISVKTSSDSSGSKTGQNLAAQTAKILSGSEIPESNRSLKRQLASDNNNTGSEDSSLLSETEVKKAKTD